VTPYPKLTDSDTCPHCGGRAIVEPSAALRWACGVCGGARILGLGAPPSAPVVRALVGARQKRAAAIGWGVAAFGLAFAGFAAAGLALILWFASHAAGVVVGVVAAMVLIGALRARSARARGQAQWTAELDVAYAAAAEQLAKERGGAITSADVAQAMRIDVAVADAILGALAVQSNVRVDVGDDAELHYRVGQGDAPASTEPQDDAARRAQREP
jgi:hypothetical protein